jgi:ubiquinone/menaquinone biosynthesis C-methylase UbiE
MTQTSADTRSPHFNREATATLYRDIQLPRVFAPWAAVLLDIVPPRPGDVVLDVATGPGTVARQAAVRVGSTGRVVGLDLSGAMLSIARGWPAEPNAAPIEYVETSATTIPYPDNTFDVAYCQHGLQHMSDAFATLEQMRRVLKPGGRLGLAIWHQSPFGRFREVAASLGVTADGPRPSEFGRQPDDFATALCQAGFQDVVVQQRELVSILDSVDQALEVALSTSAGAAMANLPPAQQEVVRGGMVAAVQPMVKPDGRVYLTSVANLAAARKAA